MQKKEPIVAILKENQTIFKEDFELKSLTLFGSYARDEQQEDSDLDLYFELEEEQKMPLRRLIRLENFIKQITFVEKIEIFNYKFINSIIQRSSEKDAIKIF